MYFIVITMITTTTHKCIKGEESGGLKEYSYKPSEEKVSFLKFHQLIELPQKNKKYSPSSEDSKMSDWC